MILKRIKVGTPISEPTNCYVIKEEKTHEAMVIDPGGDAEKIINMLDILEAKLKYIYLTHCHADHIGAVKQIQNKYGGKVLIHRNGAENLENDNIVLASYIGEDKIVLEADSRVDDEDILHVGNIEFKVLYTPGHTNCSTSLYCEKYKMLSSFEKIMDSITKKILVLPEDTIIYPGHGKSSMIKEEKPIYLDLKPRLDY